MRLLLLTLAIPAVGALTLTLVRSLRWSGWLNLLVSAATLGAALALAWSESRGQGGGGVILGMAFRIDVLNVYLVVLTAFVGLTTSIFSRPYLAHVYASGRIDLKRLRAYHGMYQTFILSMLIALTTDNLGVLWVAVEGATLATVLLVSLYRTPEAVEAAWKYFILCGVGIALALFGTVLTYFAAQHADLPAAVQAEAGLDWSLLHAHAAELDPTVMRIASSFCWSAMAPRSGWSPCISGCPTPIQRGRHPCRRCSRDCCSMSHSMP